MLHHSHTHATEEPAQTQGRLIRWASRYDLFTNILTFGQSWRLRKMTVDHAQIQPGDSVLDVGCGTGEVTIPAKIRAGNDGYAYGIDPAPEMVAVAREKAKRKNIEIDFRLGVIEALPFPDSSMDVVTSSLMMHHLPDELRVRGLAEIYRVLKPGGHVLIFDFMRPAKSFLNQLMIALTMHHGLDFGIEDLPKMLKDAGFVKATKLDEKFLFFGFVRGVK
jgi:ubiquinone/menaquinone biosynthesis C-methylase UbiE